MIVTVNLLAEGLVSSEELPPCLRDGEWARVGRDRAADADIQEELARMVRMIEDCDIWSFAVIFVVRSECVLCVHEEVVAIGMELQRLHHYTIYIHDYMIFM